MTGSSSGRWSRRSRREMIAGGVTIGTYNASSRNHRSPAVSAWREKTVWRVHVCQQHVIILKARYMRLRQGPRGKCRLANAVCIATWSDSVCLAMTQSKTVITWQLAPPPRLTSSCAAPRNFSWNRNSRLIVFECQSKCSPSTALRNLHTEPKNSDTSCGTGSSFRYSSM